MLHASSEHKKMERGVMLAQLLRLNQYALEHELITPDIYKKMEIGFRTKYHSDSIFE